MIRVVVGSADAPPDERSLVVRIVAGAAVARDHEATIVVSIADPDLARAITDDVAAAIATVGEPGPALRTVRVRSRKAVARRSGPLPGAIAIVPVTARNATHLIAIVDGSRAAGALGVQLVWDGADRARLERRVFAVLEHARATPGNPPVVLSASERPSAALAILIVQRSR